MTGFWGKLPARGDFVGIGLPRDFVAAWDGWVSAGIQTSRQMLGDAWDSAWMEAPVWCFAATPGLFGAAAVAGLWMPSADRAGRLFPLVIAAPGGAAPDWFAAAEAAGRAALAELLEPEALASLVPPPQAGPAPAGSHWWTAGAPLVARCERHYAGLPERSEFTRMLDDRA